MGGNKFNDIDADGEWDDDEPELEGWTIELYRMAPDQSWALYATTLTGADGSYFFTGLLPGVYTIVEVQQDGWVQTAGPESQGDFVFQAPSEMPEGDVDFGNHEPPFAPFPEMSLVKDVSKSEAAAGDTLTYTLTYTMDKGDLVATDVFTIVDDYDEQYMTVVDAAGGTVAGGKITWNLSGPLAEGESGSITYTLKVSDEMPSGTTEIPNTACLDFVGDNTPEDNCDDALVTVRFAPFTPQGEPFLPFTGFDGMRLALLAMLMVVAGVALRRLSRVHLH